MRGTKILERTSKVARWTPEADGELELVGARFDPAIEAPSTGCGRSYGAAPPASASSTRPRASAGASTSSRRRTASTSARWRPGKRTAGRAGTALRTRPDGSLVALVRREDDTLIGSAPPPFTDWTWTELSLPLEAGCWCSTTAACSPRAAASWTPTAPPGRSSSARWISPATGPSWPPLRRRHQRPQHGAARLQPSSPTNRATGEDNRLPRAPPVEALSLTGSEGRRGSDPTPPIGEPAPAPRLGRIRRSRRGAPDRGGDGQRSRANQLMFHWSPTERIVRVCSPRSISRDTPRLVS